MDSEIKSGFFSWLGSVLVSENILREAFNRIVIAARRLPFSDVYLQEGLVLVVLTVLDVLYGNLAGIRLFFVIPVFRLTRRAGLVPGALSALVTGCVCAAVDFHIGGKSSFLLGLLLNPIGLFCIALMANSLTDSLSQVRGQAETDALTGALNRYGFERAMGEALAERQQTSERLVIAMIDLDRFKEMNDTNGHAFGDSILRALKASLDPAVAEGGFVARIGGDEFAVVFQGLDAEDAKLRIQRARIRFRRASTGLGWQASFSFGLAEAIGPSDTSEQLLRSADEDMYRFKASARSAAVWAPEDTISLHSA